MATPTDQTGSATGGATPRLTRRALLRRFGRSGLAAGLVSTLLALPIGYAERLDGRIPHGVSVGGVAVGGLTPGEAERRLAGRFSAYLGREVRVLLPAASREWRTTPAALDVRADLAASVSRALALGRGGGPFPSSQIALLLRGTRVPLPVELEASRLEALLTSWAADTTAPPVDARFARAADGGLAIVPERAGRGFDPADARRVFTAHAAQLATGPVHLQLIPIAPAITADRLTAHAARTLALVAQPFALTSGERRWMLDADALLGALAYRDEGEGLRPNLDPPTLRPFLTAVAAAVARPPVDATIAPDGSGRYAIVPERAGLALDEAATIDAMEAALRDGRHEAAAVLGAPVPAVTATALATVYAQLDAALNTPLTIEFAEYRRVLTRADIAPLATIAPGGPNGTPATLRLDPAGMRTLATALATDLDRAARDAVFAWRDGAVRETITAQDGRAVQIEPTMVALEAAILGAVGTVAPVVAVTSPRVPASAVDAIAITDRLGGGRSDYSWSVPNRKHNVELAIGRLDGALIPPGAIFSFNTSVGEQTIENGYKEGYGIALVGGVPGGSGEVRTVTSIGGGICQVSTILFQVAYRAGLPIEERNWHLYWIQGYGAAPSGLQGLDATVDSASGLDFTFRNTTGNWLAIEAVADGAELRIALYGVDPGWQVMVADPVITNPQPADPAPQIEQTHDLAPGERVEVEHAVDGFDAANHIRVADRSGAVIREMTFTSNYFPSRNVTQVGAPAGMPLE